MPHISDNLLVYPFLPVYSVRSKNGDVVVIKFGGKAKKLFKGIIEFSAVTEVKSPNLPEHISSPCKLKSKSPSKMPVQLPVKNQKLELPRSNKLTAQKSG